MDYQDRQKYQEKLVPDGINLPDPCGVPEEYWKAELSQLPQVTFPDIYVYLINSEGIYTSDNLKAYKSLTSWDLFKSGHVGALKVFKSICVLQVCKDRSSSKSESQCNIPDVGALSC